jgi:hypothetical protein
MLTAATIRTFIQKWLAEPHQLVITLVALCLLLVGTALGVNRMMQPAALDAEALHQARSGVIVLKTNDPYRCRQLTFHNETGTFTAPLSTSCEIEPNKAAAQNQKPGRDGQLDSIRDGFRGR